MLPHRRMEFSRAFLIHVQIVQYHSHLNTYTVISSQWRLPYDQVALYRFLTPDIHLFHKHNMDRHLDLALYSSPYQGTARQNPQSMHTCLVFFFSFLFLFFFFKSPGTYLSPHLRLTSAISHSINCHWGWQIHAQLSQTPGYTRGLRWTFYLPTDKPLTCQKIFHGAGFFEGTVCKMLY